MKKKLIEAIKAQFVGIDDNTAGRLAERLIRKGDPITTEDEAVAAAKTITLSDVLKSVSDFSADDATRKYEAKYGLKNGVPEKKDPEDGKETKDEAGGKAGEKPKQEDPMAGVKDLVASMLKDLSGKIETLGTDIAAIKTGKLTESRKAKVDTVIKNLRDSQKKAYTRIPLDKMSDDEFDSFLSEISEEVNEIVAEDKANGSAFTAPLGAVHHQPGDGKEASKEELDNLVSKFNI